MRARLPALLVVTVTAVLGLYMLVRAVALVRDGELKAVLLAVGVLLLVVVGGLLVTGEVLLASRAERLGRRLVAEGAPDVLPELELRPSGRLTGESAERLFAVRKEQVEAAPQDWRCWYRLALAYGENRDTVEGRRAMRKAVRLARDDRPGADH